MAPVELTSFFLVPHSSIFMFMFTCSNVVSISMILDRGGVLLIVQHATGMMGSGRGKGGST